MNVIRLFLFASFALLIAGRAVAQIDGGGTSIIVPVVASTTSFMSEITIKDESGVTHSVSMTFYEAQTSAAPGAKTCAPISLAPFQVTTVSVATQCSLAGNHHGFVILRDASDNWFFAFSRTQNPQGIGFSVEGYPIGHIGGGDPFSEIGGVKRKAATASSPAYQTNCFVATLDDPVTYAISVDDGNGSGTLVDSLGAFQMKRYVDIYDATGAPAGDHDNTTVTFEKIDAAQFPRTLIGFCTVQDNTSFGADFRIAKTLSEADNGRLRFNCFAASFGSSPGQCTSTLLPSAPEIPNGTTKLRLLTMIHAPDLVSCSIISSSSNLEMRLVRIADNVVVASGTTSFTYNTGKRSAIGGGFHQYYFIDVGPIANTGTFPIPFGLRCSSGNGIADPFPAQFQGDDF